MTKEEEIKVLVKKKNYFKRELAARLTRVDAFKALIVKTDKEINWLSHLIRKGE